MSEQLASEVVRKAQEVIATDPTTVGPWYEPYTTSAVRRLVTPGMVCYDVGANIGWYTALFALLSGPAGTCVSIEPLDQPELDRTIYALKQDFNAAKILFLHGGLADRAYSASVHRYEHAWTLLPHGHSDIRADTPAVLVDFYTLDQLVLGPSGYPKPDIIKIDVDGGEVKMLYGAVETLGRFKPLLVLEVAPDYTRVVGDDSQVGLDLLASLGYKFYKTDPPGTPVTAMEIVTGVPKMSSWDVVCRAARTPVA